jgi:hypothetical protein
MSTRWAKPVKRKDFQTVGWWVPGRWLLVPGRLAPKATQGDDLGSFSWFTVARNQPNTVGQWHRAATQDGHIVGLDQPQTPRISYFLVKSMGKRSATSLIWTAISGRGLNGDVSSIAPHHRSLRTGCSENNFSLSLLLLRLGPTMQSWGMRESIWLFRLFFKLKQFLGSRQSTRSTFAKVR